MSGRVIDEMVCSPRAPQLRGGVAWAALLPHTRVSPANRASAGDVLNPFPPHGNLFARFVRALVGALWRAVGLWRVDAGTERACSRVYDALWGSHSPLRRRRERLTPLSA